MLLGKYELMRAINCAFQRFAENYFEEAQRILATFDWILNLIYSAQLNTSQSVIQPLKSFWESTQRLHDWTRMAQFAVAHVQDLNFLTLGKYELFVLWIELSDNFLLLLAMFYGDLNWQSTSFAILTCS